MRVRKHDGVVTLTFDRPDDRNPFTADAANRILDVVTTTTRDEQSAIVITGEGDTFCAGGDLEDLSQPNESARDRYERYARGTEFAEALLRAPVPTVAKVNGDAVGAGLSLVALCDFAYASEDAGFSAAFVNVGLIPDSGATVLLPRLIGLRDAMELALTGRTVSAADALEMGLLNDVVLPDSLDETVDSQLDRLADLPTGTLVTIRRTIHANAGRHWDEAIDHENLVQALSADTDEHRIAVEALLDNS